MRLRHHSLGVVSRRRCIISSSRASIPGPKGTGYVPLIPSSVQCNARTVAPSAGVQMPSKRATSSLPVPHSDNQLAQPQLWNRPTAPAPTLPVKRPWDSVASRRPSVAGLVAEVSKLAQLLNLLRAQPIASQDLGFQAMLRAVPLGAVPVLRELRACPLDDRPTTA